MSVNKNAAKSATYSVAKTNTTTEANNVNAPAVGHAPDTATAVTSVTEATSEAALVETEPASETPAKAGKVNKPAVEKVSETREEFVFELLDKCLPGNAAESWCGKVIEAVDKGEPVTISNVDGAPVLEIHYGMRYQDRDALRVLAGRLGRDLKFNVNHIVLAKFPRA